MAIQASSAIYNTEKFSKETWSAVSFFYISTKSLCLILVPNAVPQDVKAVDLSPFTARVSWTGIDRLNWQDESIKYVVSYKLKSGESPLKDITVKDSHHVTLTDLASNSSYVVYVSAKNTVGVGNKSENAILITKPGKCFNVCTSFRVPLSSNSDFAGNSNATETTVSEFQTSLGFSKVAFFQKNLTEYAHINQKLRYNIYHNDIEENETGFQNTNLRTDWLRNSVVRA